ncbi:MAG TPA: DUF4194 domain-containing protein [Geminicoccus sp.]|uniref:DUF4194 domain-containing protein n=1 Tax=Geminicoccus sp. TaxID=2024832 RepID=UPI002B5CA5DD|nr:DUF4194 domain-containing protein [Geminicoccus sp.]HWL69439.1 DUF4194 domain-containing protein [Geminicoccus sp.]
MLMLREFSEILDQEVGEQDDDTDLANQLRSAARMLLERQFLYADDRGAQRQAYETIMGHITYYEKLFDALGYRLLSRPEIWSVGILPMDYPGAVRNSINLLEMLFLAGLLGVYEERVKGADLSDGSRAEARLKEVWDFVAQRMGRDMPAKTVCQGLMRGASRMGLLHVGEELQDDQVITIMPAIRLVVPEDAVARLRAWAENEAPRHSDDAESPPEPHLGSPEGSEE